MGIPAFASKGTNLTAADPVIYISGDNNKIMWDNETKSFEIGNMIDMFSQNGDGNVSEAAFNILYPFILKGIAFNDWDDYYDAVYKEFSEAYEPILLDGDKQITVDEYGLTQFAMYSYETQEAVPMTVENCHDTYWNANEQIDHPQTKDEKLHSFLSSLFKLVKSILNLFSYLIKNNFELKR